MRMPVKMLLGSLLPIALALSSFASRDAWAAEKAANAYKLNIAIQKAGETVANPKFTVAFGKPAQATMSKAGQEDGLYRVQATALPAEPAADGRKTLRLDLVVMEQVAGAWVILGEPSMVLYDGTTGSVDVSGAAGAFKVEATATSEFNLRAVDFAGGSCPALDAPVARIAKTSGSVIKGIRVDPDCCSTGCADGSGQTMTCCGAIECCACGSCCRPPGG